VAGQAGTPIWHHGGEGHLFAFRSSAGWLVFLLACYAAAPFGHGSPGGSFVGGDDAVTPIPDPGGDPPLQDCNVTNLSSIPCSETPVWGSECPPGYTRKICKASASSEYLFKLCGIGDGDVTCQDPLGHCWTDWDDILLDTGCNRVRNPNYVPPGPFPPVDAPVPTATK
jgi:hypothetical protein